MCDGRPIAVPLGPERVTHRRRYQILIIFYSDSGVADVMGWWVHAVSAYAIYYLIALCVIHSTARRKPQQDTN